MTLNYPKLYSRGRRSVTVGIGRAMPPEPAPKLYICCGMPMVYADIFGVRIYHCVLRHHTVIYVNLQTGGEIVDDQVEWRQQ